MGFLDRNKMLHYTVCMTEKKVSSVSKRCYGCMKVKQTSPICEHCGYNENVPNYPNQLPVGMMLHGQYTVGKVLGQGGFGITYIGWDHSLETVVAIKEYYPSSVVNRDSHYTQAVSCNGEEAEKVFRRNKERFLKEAKILAKLQNIPGIVRVQNLFSENNTVYIVMEYVQGIDLRQYLRMHNRAMTAKELLPILRPVLFALHKVHGAGLIHRDIAPDNIMILPDGTAKLLDFGAAREVEQGQAAMESTEAILKHGFAPMEQYSRRGNLGPWTDVYALCATIYYCLTGKLPDSAAERVMGEDNVNWKTVPGLTEQQIATLEKGMELLPEGRLQSMEELFQGLYSQPSGTPAPSKAPVKELPKTQAKAPEKPAAAVKTPEKKKRNPLPAIAAALALVAAAGIFLMKPKKDAPTVPAETTPVVMEVTESTVPMEIVDAETQKRYDEAAALEESGKKAEAAMAFGKLGDVLDARERSFNLWAEVTERKTIAAGCDYTAAVKKDGSVVFDGWMDENWNSIEEWENVIALSASLNHLVGLKADGTVVAAGRNQDGQCNVSDWQDIVAIACGESHTAGLKSDGTVVAVGNNIYYEQNIHRLDVERWEDIVAISAGNFNTVGIRTDGTVIVAGYFNNWDQKTVIDWTDIVSVSAGNWHVAGVKSDGTAVAGGDDTYQRCYVQGWTDLVAVSTGYFHTLGLKSDGTVVAVGRNKDNFAKPCGQCDVSGWKNVVDIAAGWYHSVALCADGTVQVAGRDMYGKPWKEWKDILLPGEKLQKEGPEPVVDAEEAYAEAESLEAAGEYGKAAIAFGKLSGYEDAREKSLELWEKLPYPRDTVNAEDWSILAITEDGKVRSNNEGGLRGKSEWSDVIAVSMGGNAYALGLKLDGTVEYTKNEAVDYEEGYDYPVDVSNWTDIVSISAGPRHAVGLKADGTVVATGQNDDHYLGQCDVSDWKDIVAVSTGGYFTVGLKADGTVVLSGDTAYQSSLSDACYWTDITAISAGEQYIVGLKSDGTVVSAGRDTFGETKVSGWTDIVKICAGDYHTLGLKADGTVVSVGRNAEKQRDVSSWKDIVAITAGYGMSVGLKSDGTVVVAGGNAGQFSSWTDIRLP